MSRASRVLATCVTALVLAPAFAACAGDDDATTSPSSDPSSSRAAEPPFETASVVEDFVDPSRPTVRADGTEVATDRALTTTIWYPDDAEGPVPLVVLAHGYTGHPDLYDEQLGPAWAAAGYVVAAPAFPLTNRETPGGAVLADYRAQPADVSFVIDEVLAATEDPDGPLAGLIDEQHIGLAGHSLGGVTTLAVAFNTCCRDERIDAFVVFAAIEGSFDGTYEYTETPLMMMLGDADEAVAYRAGVALYERAAPPKYLVTVLGGNHSPPWEDAPDPADAAVADITTLFWDGYLGEDPNAIAALVEEGTVDGVTTFDYVAG